MEQMEPLTWSVAMPSTTCRVSLWTKAMMVLVAASMSTSTSTSSSHTPICFSVSSSQNLAQRKTSNKDLTYGHFDSSTHPTSLDTAKILEPKMYQPSHPSNYRSKRSCLFLSSRKSSSEPNKDGSDSNGNNWNLEQDWALIDAIPHFTVATESEVRTFWTQLWMSTPILFSNRYGPEDLHDRMVVLRQDQEQNEKDEQQEVRIPEFGPSPPILQNWSTPNDVIGSSSGHQRITGQTDDGRTVWFSYHLMGRLKDDPTSVVRLEGLRVGKSHAAAGGGYVEAVGGRVYELGIPSSAHTSRIENLESPQPEPSGMLDDTIMGQLTTKSSNDHDGKSLLRWDGWIRAGTATLSALLATTVLSMSIGYCAGLSIIHDNAMNQQQLYETHQQLSSSSSSSSTVYQRPIPASSAIVRVSSSSSTSTTTAVSSTNGRTSSAIRSEPSQEELRARAQYRVLHERRLLEHISQRLEQDQQTLQRLDRESASGTTTTTTTTIKTNLSP